MVDDRRFRIPIEVESWEPANPILLGKDLDRHLGLDSAEDQETFLRQTTFTTVLALADPGGTRLPRSRGSSGTRRREEEPGRAMRVWRPVSGGSSNSNPTVQHPSRPYSENTELIRGVGEPQNLPHRSLGSLAISPGGPSCALANLVRTQPPSLEDFVGPDISSLGLLLLEDSVNLDNSSLGPLLLEDSTGLLLVGPSHSEPILTEDNLRLALPGAPALLPLPSSVEPEPIHCCSPPLDHTPPMTAEPKPTTHGSTLQ